MAKFVSLKSPAGKTIKFYALSIGILQDYPDEVKALFHRRGENEIPFEPERLKKLQVLHLLSANRGTTKHTAEEVRDVVDLEHIGLVNSAMLGQLKEGDEGDADKAKSGKADSPRPTEPPTGGASTAG